MFSQIRTLGAAGLIVLSSLAASSTMAGQDASVNRHSNCTAPGVTRLPGKSIVDVAAGSPDFTTLVSVLSATNLVPTLQGKGPFTVYAPTNAAFAKIPAPVLGALVSDTKLLTQVLLYHVTPGKADFRVAANTRTLGTVQGEKVFARVTCKAGTVGTLRVNNSTVVVKPIVVDNGIIYVIDSVLLPQF